ncbi:sulfatase-like hydrolase/transferase [uncultured Draconibacterium sp.]|uniref:sulfatase family protein n=1 Tax=uncultured Draconibacterium sp. TaxID=1573823 RepID=UPI0029C80455|nr:sulfatase-like hydrolase/transferase [uncultured Draconibacterium sp.]
MLLLQPAKKVILAITVIFCFAGTSFASNFSKDSKKKKPNVILLFTDQHNKKVMGSEGHPDVITPNLDKFAEESVVFDRAYCTRGVCVPSRISLMTGMMPRTLGVLANPDRSPVENEVVSMASIFQYNGYKTFAFGKRHLYHAADEGWDVKKDHAFKPGDDDNYVSWIERNGYAKEFAEDWAAEFGKGPRGSSEFKTKIPTADLGTRISKLPEEYTMEAYTTMETIKTIKEQANSNQPFLCWASFYRPHQPYNPLQKYMDMYDVSTWGEGTKNGSSIKMPKNFYQPTETLPPMLQDQRNGGNKVWNMDKAFENEQLWRNYIGGYYALVTEIDHCVGEILKALDEAGIEDETIVIYTSDHGDFVGNHGMVEKCASGHNVYEDILNIPLMIKIPGNKNKGKRTAELVTNADILPTLIDLLDLEMPKTKYPIQGESLTEIVTGNGAMNRDYIVSESWAQATVITENAKLGIMLDPNPVWPQFDYRKFGDMFFDMKKDPLEVDNKINDKKYKKEITKLRTYYEEFVNNTPSTGKDLMIKQKQQD